MICLYFNGCSYVCAEVQAHAFAVRVLARSRAHGEGVGHPAAADIIGAPASMDEPVAESGLVTGTVVSTATTGVAFGVDIPDGRQPSCGDVSLKS